MAEESDGGDLKARLDQVIEDALEERRIALRLVENGRMGLGDSVRRWLPEFTPRLADGRVPDITIHHLLTHSAGLTYVFMEPEDGPYQDPKTIHLAELAWPAPRAMS